MMRPDALVDALHGLHDGLNVAGVADHIAVREVAAQEVIFAGLHGLDQQSVISFDFMAGA